MPENNMNVRTIHAKRQILIVEDEFVNREILNAIFEETYDVLDADSGEAALKLIYEKRETLSIILLDLLLPDMNGMDILHHLKGDPLLSSIPVIVMTADRESEVECLNLGAIDFIPKPYPQPKVVQARVRRTIELSEDRDLIGSTERDHLTGLYNKEYFFSYVGQMDIYHPDVPMDAIMLNINHFHMINERYGKSYGDDVLCHIAHRIREYIGADGIVCRRDGDNFLVYCQHRTDYMELLSHTSDGLDSRVRLRMGIYPMVDKGIDADRRFDRAKMAADTVRNSFTKTIAVYDNALHEAEIFSEQLLEDFPRALAEKQFLIYFQPKFDIRPDSPILNSAEALVRWKHPELGMISPGAFIPLFESNGLIQQLDSYVWREAARQMQDWKNRLGISVPVSVNVSRADMFDPDLLPNFQKLIREFGLTSEEFLLEITESAYTEDSAQIIKTVNNLREAGFRIEMDDFGSGYSSLNMLSSLPVDALKLDMEFLRNAFRERKNIKILDVVIDIADSLEVPTIAEGVETAEQMMSLRSMGCDIAQGYFFSRPVPPGEYERFLIERRERAEKPLPFKKTHSHEHSDNRFTYDALHDPLTGLYNHSAYEILMRDADQAHIALLIAAVDEYELIKARYGREVADRVIERVADVLKRNFRSVDYICRISNDEFVVIVTRVNSSMRKLISDKIEQINSSLIKPRDGLPAVTLSAGVAFADREHPEGDIFQDADAALYHMKELKRCGVAFY